MMETKHTPGPWEVGGYGVVRVDRVGEETYTTAIADCPSTRLEGDEAPANAALIAAAPELLQSANNAATAIRILLRESGTATVTAAEALYMLTGENFDVVLNELDAALAKAEGR